MSVQVTAQQLRAAAKTTVNEQNMNSVLRALEAMADGSASMATARNIWGAPADS